MKKMTWITLAAVSVAIYILGTFYVPGISKEVINIPLAVNIAIILFGLWGMAVCALKFLLK